VLNKTLGDKLISVRVGDNYVILVIVLVLYYYYVLVIERF
jgi:hypothetical protein